MEEYDGLESRFGVCAVEVGGKRLVKDLPLLLRDLVSTLEDMGLRFGRTGAVRTFRENGGAVEVGTMASRQPAVEVFDHEESLLAAECAESLAMRVPVDEVRGVRTPAAFLVDIYPKRRGGRGMLDS